ncbi:MAG: hypothetical protein GYA21_02995 [Myxococcales bacterium]|nr:hypothetical protein [Myxococcales bacterium]
MAASGGFFKYVKRAFLVHWNLLAVAAGTALGLISGQPDVVLPLVAAGEVVYLAGLATHPRFQTAIDAEENKSRQQSQVAESRERSRRMFESLAPEDQRRFERLRALCLNLREIAVGLQGEGHSEVVADLQSSGINKLLWIYLKLLYSKNALEQFFETIDVDQINADIRRTEKRLKELGEEKPEEPAATGRMRKSLQDHLATSNERLANYEHARQNYELVQVDLERLYSKIASLGEKGINRQEPNFIASEVDAVSASVQQTEKAMSELNFLSGLGPSDELPPSLLDEEKTAADS